VTARLFTLADAVATLPYVQRVATDLLREYRTWQEVLGRYELAAAHRRPDDDDEDATDPAATLEQEAARLATSIDGYLAELAAVGAVANAFGVGGIDFPGELDGAPVRWSWMPGEPTITHLRAGHTGDAERVPVRAVVDTYSDGAR
jgi:hypothetical protein